MPVSMLPPRPLDESRMKQLNARIASGKGSPRISRAARICEQEAWMRRTQAAKNLSTWPASLPRPIQLVIQKFANHHCVTLDELKQSQSKSCVAAKMDIVCHLRDEGCSLSEIGRYLGMNHTSIHYLERRGRGETREEAKHPQAPKPRVQPDVPDFSGEWAI
jgi:hypothetical protein